MLQICLQIIQSAMMHCLHDNTNGTWAKNCQRSIMKVVQRMAFSLCECIMVVKPANKHFVSEPSIRIFIHMT